MQPPSRVLIVLALLYSATAHSATLTPEQALKYRRISDLTFSQNGTRLACVVTEPAKGPTPESHIWMLDLADQTFTQFTSSAKSESSPRWSPDGRTLAFLSNRDERMQIYTLQSKGGEATALTSGKNAIESFRWSPDGTQIAFSAKEIKSDADEKKEKDKDDPKVADLESDLSRIWVVDVSSKKTRQVSKGQWRIDQFEWLAPDRLLTVASNEPRQETWNEALYNLSLADGVFTHLLQPNQPFGGISVSPGQTHLAFAAARHAGPTPHDLFIANSKGEAVHNVTATIDRQVRGVKWQNDSTAVVSVADGFRNRLYRIPVDGSPSPIDLPFSNGAFDVSNSGTLAFVGLAFNRVAELYLAPASGPPQQVSHFQKDWEGIPLANAELFRFKSFDGKQIDAALMKPPVPLQGNGKAPLILYVHGGPAGNFSADYQSWPQLLVAHGYQVLMVNPRGSSSNGEDFLKANKADWGGGDFKDLMAAVDALLARGETDQQRLGIGGWSYGGYMAEWAVTQTDRFKAAVAGAGMFDLAAEFGTEDGPAGDEWYFGTPWEHPERFAHSSPYTYVRNAKTPTLILQGENDPIDPVGQSTALYRALKRYGVKTELVTYPREPHGPREEKHQIDILTRMLAWFDLYLLENHSKNPR